MDMHDRLVVGYDGSAASSAAIEWAAAEAEKRSAAVRVISSYAMPPVMEMYGMGLAYATADELEQLQKSCQSALQHVVEKAMRDHPRVGFDFCAVDQPPAQRLLVEARNADLLVVGSNGLGATKDFLLGSVVGQVLHESPCAVVVVPTTARTTVSQIVVGVDDSDPAMEALMWAVDEAERRGAELCVIHAWKYPYALTDGGIGRGRTFVEVDAAIVLETALEAARARTAGTVTGKLLEGGAAHVLLNESAEAALTVVGTRGRGGFRSMLLGSVAHAVSAHAACPVVVVR